MRQVSLILTTYNCKENFIKTFNSIEEQDYPNIEVVIVDGGSTDGTLEEIIRCAEASSRKVKWISEKDKGIFDAMNKGYKLSTGEIIGCFNDLYYRKDAVSKLVSVIINDMCGAHADLIYCEGEKVKRVWKMGNGSIRRGWMAAHPTLLLKREIYEEYGLYKDDYRCAADYEFMIRILKGNKEKLEYVPEVLVSMYYGGTSSNSLKAYLLSLKEAYRALRENQIAGAGFISILKTIRVILQFV